MYGHIVNFTMCSPEMHWLVYHPVMVKVHVLDPPMNKILFVIIYLSSYLFSANSEAVEFVYRVNSRPPDVILEMVLEPMVLIETYNNTSEVILALQGVGTVLLLPQHLILMKPIILLVSIIQAHCFMV